MRVIVRYPAVAVGLTAFALGIAGCNGDERTRAGNGATDTSPARSESLGAPWKRTRAKSIEGPLKVGRPAEPSVVLPSRKRLARLGLTLGPPANLVEACKRVSRQTPLTVYCPPIVPRGPVEAPRRRHENAYVYGDEHGYGLSLQSESLIDPERARAYDPDGPPITFPNRPSDADFVWDPFAAKHWAVAATAPARVMRHAVDPSAASPRAEFKSKPRHFTVEGVEATLLTGDIAGTGFAASGHAIAYWQIDNILYQASVHFDDKAPVAEAIARGLIVQMVECVPGSTAHQVRPCEWVFPGHG